MIVKLTVFVLIAAVWSAVSIRGLRGRGQNKEAALYGGIMGISVALGCLFIARVNLPSFILPSQMLFEPVGKLLLGK
ncbi:hypothetical protein SAMN02799624_00664 [Paenibacillus sp. UNC496MF]|uniref:hypothetical protein n=1 Tax=Paenibacillus sp. UNC496MF TaxID=1502753 RepID=UPI0008ED031B|nr:hypothetical protein [Paenibacillus sp. UNC496MF]SFI37353.1 hypothetical protein SAMN02799624_00664 [Paenibacillus sp. UNC496MF]